MTAEPDIKNSVDNTSYQKTEIKSLYNRDKSKRATSTWKIGSLVTILVILFLVNHDVRLHNIPLPHSLIFRGPVILPIIVWFFLFIFKRSMAENISRQISFLFCLLLICSILGLTILSQYHISYITGIIVVIFINCLIIQSGKEFIISTFLPVILFFIVSRLYFKPELLSVQLLNNVLSLVFAGLLFALVISKLRFERFLSNHQLKLEQQRSENLLLNILPQKIAQRLIDGEKIIADNYDQVTIIFSDIVEFTNLSAHLTPQNLVQMLNELFTKFDNLTTQYRVEKIKTIGDAYMAVAGIPEYRKDHAEAVANLALEMKNVMEKFRDQYQNSLNIRIGIHSGPVVAGVIGKKKFAYDLWGDTVNVASRMESNGLTGEIQVSQSTYEILKNHYYFGKRGEIDVKGKGKMNTWILKHKI